MEINTQDILNRFKVIESDMLFDVGQFEMYAILKENRCLKCGNKLKFLTNGKLAICSSKKHKKPFVISVAKLNKINGK